MKIINKLCLIVLFFVSTNCHAQSYGLQFAGNEVTEDYRTGLDLGSGLSLQFGESFNLSFQLCLLPGQKEYFGYIVRLIDSNGNNIDLIYDTSTPEKKQIMIVAGNQAMDFPDPIEKPQSFINWTQFVLNYAHDSQMLTVTIGNRHYKRKVNFSPVSLRILFGANYYKDFKSTDCPAMKLRDIRIMEDDRVRYYWPLNDRAGDKAMEIQEGKNAIVTNPKWVSRAHSEWSRLNKFDAKGRVSVAFDPNKDLLYIIGKDSLYTLAVNDGSLTSNSYSSGPSVLMKGNQSYYAKENNQLYNLHIDQEIVSTYDWSKRSWDKKPVLPDGSTNFWHFNKLWSPDENAFYIFNGYGHFKYKNTVRRFDVKTGKTQTLKPSGDRLAPRYLAGLGPVKGGAYLIGGYGSISGQQIANPKNFYDFFYFSTKNNSFKKIYQLEGISEDFVFSNSLVIDEPSHYFYGLIFPKHQYHSYLQLVKGSLTKPNIEKLGNNIPFTFHDNASFSDLFYSTRTKRFIAVTLWAKNPNVSEVAIYSIDLPTLPLETATVGQAINPWENWYLKIVILLTGTFVTLLIFRLEKKEFTSVSQAVQPRNVQTHNAGMPSITLYVGDASLTHRRAPEIIIPLNKIDENTLAGSIYLFGDLEVFDSKDVDITKYFTPLVKELFLAVLLYTIRWKRGISSDELTELLWYDKSSESARNNRSVNIAKLKTILERMQFCQLSKETGNWRVNIDHQKIRVDYYDYLNIIHDKSKLDKQKIKEIAEIIKRGSFLKKLDYEWLDMFKSEISEEVIDTYLFFAKSTQVSEDPEFLIRIAGYIFDFDPVNEEAMILKCKALAYLGKHSSAKATFENFCKEYKSIYGKDFPQAFNSIL